MRVLLVLAFCIHASLSFWATNKGRDMLVDIWKDWHGSKKLKLQAECDSGGVCVDPNVDTMCENDNNSCEKWAGEGECDRNPTYMLDRCKQACKACMLDVTEFRCVRHKTSVPAKPNPGDIDATFHRILKNYPEYTPKFLNEDPYIIELDNFLTDAEIKVLRDTMDYRWTQSVDAGKMGKNGKFETLKGSGRTSSTIWCTAKCYHRPEIEGLMARIDELIGVPAGNFEYPQLLRYYKTQHYNPHHDYIFGHNDLPIGARIFTFFMYLSDVEEGGETHFPQLGVKVKPVRGKTILWANVRNDDPTKKDFRTGHAALPVTKGEKYSINLWIHQYNFHDAFEIGCTG